MEEMEFRKKYAGREEVTTIEEFSKLIQEAKADANDYGSIVVCSALVMNAAFNLLDPGITGFQAGCLMWEMVKKYGMYPEGAPLRIVDYTNLLYPQYANKFNSITPETWAWVQSEAKKKLEEANTENWHRDVIAHLKSVANGNVPFGLKVVDG